MGQSQDLAYRALSAMSPSGIITVREQVSKAIEDGVLYSCLADFPALAAGGKATFLLEVGPIPSAVLELDIRAQISQLTFEIFEDNTSTTGAAPKCLNVNRLYPSPDLQANVTPSVPAAPIFDGTDLIGAWPIYGQDNGGNVGDIVAETITNALVMKPNSTYLLVLTNTSAVAGNLSIAVQYIDR